MDLEQVVRDRIRQSRHEIEFSLRAIRQNNPFAAEPSEERRARRLQRKLNIERGDAGALNAEVLRRAAQPTDEVAEAVSPVSPVMRRARGAAEAIWGDTIDFVSVGFLEMGARVARSVGRIAYKSGKAKGSGVLIGEGLFLTNHHVIGAPGEADECLLEFDYERKLSGGVREPTRFRIDHSIFITDPVTGLDFTIFAVGEKWDGPLELGEFGLTPLSDAGDKHMIGEFANIIQHPRGRFKEVVLRENRLVNRFDDALHYVADTEPGSSGSPVYNSEWQLIALHHWGGPWIDHDSDGGPASFEINEGIRASSIVRRLRNRMGALAPHHRVRVSSVLGAGGEVIEARSIGGVDGNTQQGSSPATSAAVTVAEDGTATWTLPLEVSVRIPALATQSPTIAQTTMAEPAQTAAEVDVSFDDRKGYLPDFIPGFHVPLPQLGPGLRNDAAPLLNPEPGANPFELKYHHFSVVVNKHRRLAFFTACMIDGKSSKSIVRKSRKVSDLSPTSKGLREALEELDAAEADSWSLDPRLDRQHYSGDEIYKKQKVPGFPNPQSSGRIARMFQKGHLVRRLDPAWGDKDQALAAELDTFYWTNAAPQVGFFNQGTADDDQPGTGSGNLWRAAENYVLRNAVAEDQRVVSFTGPIFRDDDRKYRHIKIPGKFFKVTVWAENGRLRSLALLVDQAQVFDAWPESFGSQEFLETAAEAEAFLDVDELKRVKDFLTTVKDIEDQTELDFGDLVRSADVRAGSDPLEVTSDSDLPLDGGSPMVVTLIPGALSEPDGREDDLTKIQGIGPSLKRLLNENGIFHFRQIAAWGSTEVSIVDTLLKFPGRIVRDNWVAQASDLSQ